MSASTASPYLVDLFGLAGKTAVVVGGTGTLGGAIADALARAGLTSSSPVATPNMGPPLWLDWWFYGRLMGLGFWFFRNRVVA